jgi:hypothetical protein
MTHPRKAAADREFCPKCHYALRHPKLGNLCECKKPKSIEAWAILMRYTDGSVGIDRDSIRGSKHAAMSDYAEFMKSPWRKLYQEGDRCIRVSITPL